jgi:glutamine---fructose-6-phosphate transaminase (isomerizing)
MPSAMEKETREIPEIVGRILDSRSILEDAASHLRRSQPPMILLCARGSSAHAGAYIRQLIETFLSIPVCELAPSIVTAYDCLPAVPGAAMIILSQSGASPDLLAVARAARARKMPVIGIVNDTSSPLANSTDLVIPMAAGPELAVAATKSVAATMISGLLLIISWAQSKVMLENSKQLPRRLEKAIQLDWSSWGKTLVGARAAFVATRGYGLGPAREIALKISETLRVPSIGESAAELMHGPRAAIDKTCSTIVLRVADNTANSVDTFCGALKSNNIYFCSVGGSDGTLPWIGDGNNVLDPLCWLPPAYLAIEQTARGCGLDPDRPRFLTKVTHTF